MTQAKRVFDELLAGRRCCAAIQAATGLPKSRVQDALDGLRKLGVIHAVGRVRLATGRGGPQTLWSVILGKEGWQPRAVAKPAPKPRQREVKTQPVILPSRSASLGVFAGLLR